MNQSNDKEIKENLLLNQMKDAKKDLKSAQILLKENKYREASNCAYNGIYHVIVAIHALDGNVYQGYNNVFVDFVKHYIKTGIFSGKLWEKIYKAGKIHYASERDASYMVTREETEEQIQTGEELIERLDIRMKRKKDLNPSKEQIYPYIYSVEESSESFMEQVYASPKMEEDSDSEEPISSMAIVYASPERLNHVKDRKIFKKD